MDEETTGFWMVALGAATATGTWEGFRISPLRHTAELHVDGALTIKDDHPVARDYALVLSARASARTASWSPARAGPSSSATTSSNCSPARPAPATSRRCGSPI